MELRALTKERDNYINELYRTRMDINKKINLLEEKNSAIEQLTKRLQCETERAQKILTQDQKISQLKSDILQYMQMLKQVQKHLKTLMKYLHDQVQTTKDPNVIESTNRQIRSIEKLSNEVKQSMKSQQKRPATSEMHLFSMSDSAFEQHSDSTRTAQKGMLAIVSRESILCGQQLHSEKKKTKGGQLLSPESMPSKRPKIAQNVIELKIGQEQLLDTSQ